MSWIAISIVSFFASHAILAKTPAFQIRGRPYWIEDLEMNERLEYFKLVEKDAALSRQIARETYLTARWNEMAQKAQISQAEARRRDIIANMGLQEIELTEVIADLEKKGVSSGVNRREMAIDLLAEQKSREVIETILNQALLSGELKLPIATKVAIHPKDSEPSSESARSLPRQDGQPPCRGETCKLTIIEYCDYQNTACQKLQPIALQLLEEFRGQLQWVSRDAPLPFNSQSRLAAIGALCAASEKQFWQMRQLLFDHRLQLDRNELINFAKKLNLNGASFSQCLSQDLNVRQKLRENQKSLQMTGSSELPVLVMNGKIYEGRLLYSDLRKALLAALN